jgi:hypothetical protein
MAEASLVVNNHATHLSTTRVVSRDMVDSRGHVEAARHRPVGRAKG